MKSEIKRLHIIYLSIIVILIIVIAGGYYYFHKKQTSARMVMAGNMGPGMAMMGRRGMPGRGMGMMMVPVTPPPLSDQQTQQLTAGQSTAATQKTFNITGGNFYFVPDKITVKKGDRVTFVLTNAGGVHDLVIDQLGVKTPVLRTAQAATVTFTVSKAGSFVYYCTIPGHRAKGMWGTLVVQ